MDTRQILLALGMSGLISCGSPGRPKGEPILVSAAVSLSDALTVVGQRYEETTGTPVILNLAGSDTLATQLVAGAPVDVFLSADERQMDRVEEVGGIMAGTRVDLLANQLAVVVARDAPARVSGVADLLMSHVMRVAMGDPEAVPAGVYAQQYLDSIGLWELLRPKVVPTRSVRAALASVEAGNADVAFVYRTDLSVSDAVTLAFFVPVDESPPIRYPVAVTTGGPNPQGSRHFLVFLRDATASKIFSDFGFVTLDGRPGS